MGFSFRGKVFKTLALPKGKKRGLAGQDKNEQQIYIFMAHRMQLKQVDIICLKYLNCILTIIYVVI